MDENGNIVGVPQIKNISKISENIKTLMKDYPYSLVIKYKKGNVRYKIGNAIEVTYWIREYTNYFVKIAPHWNYYFYIHVLQGDCTVEME